MRLLLCAGLLLAELAVADPQVLARRNDLTAYLLDCTNGVAALEVVAPEGEMFADLAGDFGTILRSLKIILPQACPGLKRVTVKGNATGDLWFAGAALPDNDWEFVSLYAPPLNSF